MEPRENNSFGCGAPSSHLLAAVGREGPENGAPKAARRDARLHQTASPLREVHAVNEYCIDVLVRAARSSCPGTLPLVVQLRDVLVEMTPAIRERAARRSFLLTDMEFGNAGWWSRVVSYPLNSVGAPRCRGSLARPYAVQLARATLTLAWHSVRADRRAAGVLLGMSEMVADVLASLSLPEIEQLVGRQFRHVHPRWEDRPGIWLQLLQASRTADIRCARDFNLRGLKLITGALANPADSSF